MNSCVSYQTSKTTSLRNSIAIVQPAERKKHLYYSLNENEFDPSKFSPPNNFLENLKKRMVIYSETSKLDLFLSSESKLDNRKRE